MREFKHGDWTIGFPDEWLDSSLIVLSGPPAGGFSPNITVIRDYLTFTMSAQQYADNQLPELRAELADQQYEVVDEGSIKLGISDAYYRIHTFMTEDNDAELMQLQVYVTRGQEAITITCTHLRYWFEQMQETFWEAVKMFTWGAPRLKRAGESS